MQIMMSTFILKYLYFRKVYRVAIFGDIIEVVTIFIQKYLKTWKKLEELEIMH